MKYINEDFDLHSSFCDKLRKQQPQFGYNGFGEIVYYRTYSRRITGDFGEVLGQEGWADTCIRVVNGTMAIRKDWYVRNRISWNENRWQAFAQKMCDSMFRMEWLPPGRGLWAMGTDLLVERGAMALYNCSFSEIGIDWVEDLCWLMDCLMFGVGAGFRPIRSGLVLRAPSHSKPFVVPDSREGWVDLLRHTLNAFQGGPLPIADYSQVRPFGSLIKTFGGEASGPEPLANMIDTVVNLCYQYANGELDEIQFKTDVANLIGVCVVAGNVRRSAEIGLCEMDDPIFLELKDYKKYPYRVGWGWMSNNSAILSKKEHFEYMDVVAQANINGHDMGYLNLINVKKGRIGKDDGLREDLATGLNPCGEIPLEHREVCNLSETLPTRCADTQRWLEACEYACFYSSTVTLLPTHQPSTNAVISRNRRIGVGIIDFTGWKEQEGLAAVTRALREGYKHIRAINRHLAEEAGIRESVRVTTMKPGGTVPKVAGRTSGAGHPTFHYTLRRINVGVGTPIDKVLITAGVPYEDSVYTPNTHVFEYPIVQGPACPATEVTIWEQAMNVVLLQREWADNAVSNTLYFKPKWSQVAAGDPTTLGPIRIGEFFVDPSHPCFWINRDGSPNNQLEHVVQLDRHDNGLHGAYHFQEKAKIVYAEGKLHCTIYRYNPNHEEDQLEDVLSHIVAVTKSVSLLPHSDVGIFRQMPEEGITKQEYEKRLAAIAPIDWSNFGGSDGMDEKFCTGDNCEVALPKAAH